MTIREAIDTAVQGGYQVHSLAGIDTFLSGANSEYSVWTRTDNASSLMVPVEETFLDPRFWQAFAYGMGWQNGVRTVHEMEHGRPTVVTRAGHQWLAHWHSFIDYLAAGHTAASFFAGVPAPGPEHSGRTPRS